MPLNIKDISARRECKGSRLDQLIEAYALNPAYAEELFLGAVSEDPRPLYQQQPT